MIVKDQALLLKLETYPYEKLIRMFQMISKEFSIHSASDTPNALFHFTKLHTSHLHITLTSRKKFAKFHDTFVLPDLKIPTLEFEEGIYMASRTKNKIKKKSLVVRIRNQSAMREFVDRLYWLQGNYGDCLKNPEPHREFHLTIANNQAGDPFCSISDVGKLKRDFMKKIN